MMKNYKPHPLSELFPAMTGEEMTKLTADIKAHGLRHPIITYDGMILDGRHRMEACQMAGVKPRFQEYDGDDAVAFAVSSNLHRRSLTASQRAMVAAKLENMPAHRPENKDANLHTSRTEAAETLAVSPRSVATAAKILVESPKLAKQISDGKISIHAAEKKLSEPKPIPALPKQKDKTGLPIPVALLPFWNRGSEPAEAVHRLGELRGMARQAQEEKDPLYNEVTFSALMAALDTAVMQFKGAVPYAVCPACNGVHPKHCTQCRERGFVSKFTWDQTVPAEVKSLREKATK